MRDQALAAFERQVAQVRAGGVLGRSAALLRLFDYLADQAGAGRPLREADVAADVFGRADALAGDASVRVYVHRLRRKLDAFYSGQPAGPRLVIPLGEYRLDLQQREAVRPPQPRRLGRRAALVAAALVLLAANLAAWALIARQPAPARELSRVAAAPLWSGIAASSRPLLVVVGDYYIFGDTGGGDEPQRMLREFTINSPADLDAWLMDNPQMMGRYIDLDTWYTPVGATLALRDLMPLLRQVAGDKPGRLRVITASELRPEMLKSADIVYVGYLSALGLLQAPALAGSRFEIGETFDELIDRTNGQAYVSGAGRVRGDAPNRDYGYFAHILGPTGAHLVIIAGARDIGVMQTAELATGRTTARTLGPADPGGRFEALYEVQGVGRTNLSARRVAP
ncbi:hypothetical protein [Phenylobacterium sp.]|uniref:hypothetical protein n=1 Tax=Phenylobacterium sp. TaxID=1871053 RepID=UPI0039835ACB